MLRGPHANDPSSKCSVEVGNCGALKAPHLTLTIASISNSPGMSAQDPYKVKDAAQWA